MDLKITPSGQTIVKPTALGPGANTDTKLLIYGLLQKGRVLAQDGVRSAVEGAKIGLNETSGGSRRSYLLKAGTPSLFNRAATSAPALCVLTLLSM